MNDYDVSSKWYHGNISRESSENLLIRKCNSNPTKQGVFLVRQSSSQQKFILSCLFNNKVYHFPIKQHANDAFFSLNGKEIVQGLDQLIKFYQENYDESLGVNLSSFTFVTGFLPPEEYSKRGKDSPLHLVVKANVFNNVKNLVLSKTICVDVKNNYGRTALHLACMQKEVDKKIPNVLIENGASITIRDWTGNTPFIYACENGFQDIVEQMISKNKEVIQVKNSETFDVPLHVACRFGRLEIVKILLKNRAALRPQNNAGQFPVDVATQAKQRKIVAFLNNYRAEPTTNCHLWDHGNLSRKEAHKRLVDGKVKLRNTYSEEVLSGLFLVRYSENIKLNVITMLEKNEIMNFEIMETEGFFHLEHGAFMESLDLLISHYMEFSDGLSTKLTIPLNLNINSTYKRSESTFSVDSIDDNSSPRNSLDNPECSADSPCTFDNPDYFTQSDTAMYANTDENERVYNEIDVAMESGYLRLKKRVPVATESNLVQGLFIDKNNLEISHTALGEGCFGAVCRGILIEPGKTSNVAVKTLHCTDDQKVFCSFLREAAIMMNFDHPHVVKMIGIVKGPPMCIVQELQMLGSLSDYLDDHGNLTTSSTINIWATQIAAGMEYLEAKRFVHRDLAARNILLASRTHAKISDFGLSRTISVENKTFNAIGGEKLPFRWYAPECFEKTFSHASDVWSFGVTLWECYSKGATPYSGMSAIEVMKFINRGERLYKPKLCSNDIFKIILECWQFEGNQRPTFHKLAQFFKTYAPIYENKDLLVS